MKPLLSEFLKNSFLPFVETRFKEFPKTAIYYQEGVARLLSSQLAGLKLDEITDQHAAKFEAQHSQYSASTINQALRTLRRSMRLAEEWGEVIRAPKITLAKGERQRERIVTEEEFNRYIMACRQPWRDAALLINCLGLRPTEVYTLRWENISLTKAGFLQIVRGKSKAARQCFPLLVPIVHSSLQARHSQQGLPKEGWVFRNPAIWRRKR